MVTHLRGGISILGAMALCCAVSVFSKDIPPSVQPKTSASSAKETSETKELATAEEDIIDIDSDVRKEAAKTLTKLASDKKILWISYTARASLADYYIEENDLKKASDVLKDCNDYTKIGASKDTDHGTAYLKCFLEYAKLEAAKKNIAESLKMANYAEGKTEGIDKILVYCKYGEILGTPEVNQPENAKKYFEKALKICNEKLKKLGDASVGEAKEDVSKEKREWVNLKKQINEQQEKLQSLYLQKEFGLDYSTYYLMMSAFYAKNYIKAQFYANKILQSSEKSIYTAAAQFHHAICTMNIPESKKSSKVDAGVKEAEAELKKFIKEKPYGDYRGDALASLGAMELERNFNAKASEKYYDEALAWFKYQRELKNATDLFVIPDKVKEISKPKGKSTSLDEWNRVVYRTPSALEIITPQSAPWSIDEKEKEYLFMKGLFLFMDNKFTEAGECWKQVKNLDKDLAMLDAKGVFNIGWRLSAACNVKRMIFAPEDRKAFKGKNELRIAYGELNYLLERFDTAISHFNGVLKDPNSSSLEKAAAHIGIGSCYQQQCDKANAGIHFDKALLLSGGKGPLYEKCLIAAAQKLMGEYKGCEKALKLYEEYLKKYPNGRFWQEAKYYQILCYSWNGDDTKAKKLFNESGFLSKYPDSNYTKNLKDEFAGAFKISDDFIQQLNKPKDENKADSK